MECRVSDIQIDELLNYMVTHPAIVKISGPGPRSKDALDREWSRLAKILNAHRPGALKSGERWKKYWALLKTKVKARAALRRQEATGTGGGPSSQPPISAVDEKVLSIIGEGAVYGDSQHRVPVFENDPLLQDRTEIVITTTESEHNYDGDTYSGEKKFTPSKSGHTRQSHSETPDDQVTHMQPHTWQSGIESPAKRWRSRFKRRLFQDQSTKAHNTSDQRKADSWIVEFERRRIAAEEKMANAAMIIAEGIRSNGEILRSNGEILRSNGEILRSNGETLNLMARMQYDLINKLIENSKN